MASFERKNRLKPIMSQPEEILIRGLKSLMSIQYGQGGIMGLKKTFQMSSVKFTSTIPMILYQTE